MGHKTDAHAITGRERLEYTMAMLVPLRDMAVRDRDTFLSYALDMTILHISDVLTTPGAGRGLDGAGGTA